MGDSTINDAEDPLVLGFVIATCVLSMIGTFFIVFSYFRWKDLQTTSRLLLVYLSLADFLTAVGNLVGSISPNEGTLCTAQSFVTTYSSMVSFHWTVYIAWYLYLCMPGNSVNPAKILPFFHMFAWGLPLAIVITALAMDKLGPSTVGWCWIGSDEYVMPVDEVVMWGWITGKAWEIISYIITFILYYLIRRKMRQMMKISPSFRSGTSLAMTKADTKLALIPFIFVCIRIWGTADFIMLAVSGEDPDLKWLKVMQGMGDSAQGLANGILFCLATTKVRQKYISCFTCQSPKAVPDEDEPILNAISQENQQYS